MINLNWIRANDRLYFADRICSDWSGWSSISVMVSFVVRLRGVWPALGPPVGSDERFAPIAINTAAVATWFASAAIDNGVAPFASFL